MTTVHLVALPPASADCHDDEASRPCWPWVCRSGTTADGYGVCGTDERIDGIVTALPPGDTPARTFIRPGKDPAVGTSQQSFHPKEPGQDISARSYAETPHRRGL